MTKTSVNVAVLATGSEPNLEERKTHAVNEIIGMFTRDFAQERSWRITLLRKKNPSAESEASLPIWRTESCGKNSAGRVNNTRMNPSNSVYGLEVMKAAAPIAKMSTIGASGCTVTVIIPRSAASNAATTPIKTSFFIASSPPRGRGA